jgi:hypothetical protein
MRDDHSPAENLYACFRDALAAIEGSDIDMFELRPRSRSFEEALSGDYDFVVNPEHLPRIVKVIFDKCIEHGVHFTFDARALNKRVIRLVLKGSVIIIEAWLNVELAGPGGRRDRREIPGASLSRELRSLSEDDAQALKAAIYLTHLYYKSKNIAEPLQQQRFRFFRNALSSSPLIETSGADAAKKRLREAYDRLLQNGGHSSAAANRDGIAYLEARGLSPIRRRFPRFRRRLRGDGSMMRPIVPLIGPDGVGKTYLCENLVSEAPAALRHLRYKRFFRNLEYKYLISCLKWIFRNEEFNQLDERISGYVVIKSTLASIGWSLVLRWRGKTLFVDRYAWDYLFTGIRRVQEPPTRIRMHRLFLWMIPRPNKCVVLMCGAQTILRRKAELDEDRILFVYNEYIRHVASGRAQSTFFCNSEMAYEDLREDLNAFVAGDNVQDLSHIAGRGGSFQDS